MVGLRLGDSVSTGTGLLDSLSLLRTMLTSVRAPWVHG